MKVLVTGATGFIGSHLTERLIEEGYVVKVLARESSNVTLLKSLNVEILLGEVTDTSTVDRAVRDCEQVYHLAASTSWRSSSRERYFTVNVEGTKNLANAALKSGIKRFVYCSTGGVYGFVNSSHPLNEYTKTNPNSYYRESKLLGENVLSSYYEKENLPLVTARISSVYGPRSSNWLGLFQSIAKEEFKKIGDGDNCIQMGYVTDIVSGLLQCGKVKGIEGEYYIIAGSEKVTLKQFSNMIADDLGVEIPSDSTTQIPFRVFNFFAREIYSYSGYEVPRAHRYELFLANRTFDISKAKKELGYKPEVSMREGIKRTVGWYRENGYL